MTTFVEEYRDVQDKSDWGDGPWQREPDKAVWVDESTGLDCMINRGPMGSLCGYVGVPEGHPFFGKGYSECLEHGSDCDSSWEHKTTGDVDVHGGLTYAGACGEGEDPAKGICHIPQPGRPDHVWWFGFDCAHAWDLVPSMEASNRRYYEKARSEGDAEGMRIWGRQPEPDQTYRNVRYVESEVRDLARQLSEVA